MLNFSESGVSFESEEIKGTRPWEKYIELEVKETVFLLFYVSLRNDNYHIISKSAFAADDELIGFCNLLRRKRLSIVDIHRRLPSGADL
ncbi:YcxB family protein [Acaryochloris thomasi]